MATATAREKVMAARADLVLEQPFFGVLALRLKIKEDPGCETAWTDGVSIGYDPDFVNTISREQLLGVIAHEVLHCANGHPWRRDNRDPERFNIACDYAINYVLEEARFKLPEFRLRDQQYDGKSAEWIYARLPKPKKQPQQGGGSGQGQDGKGKGQSSAPGTQQGKGKGQQQGPGKTPTAGGCDVRDAPNKNDNGAAEAEWQQAVQQAALAAKAAGSLPGGLERFVGDVVKPRVDWRSVLRRFVQSVARSDYTWRMPNPRYLGLGMYLPALRSERMGPIAIGVDVSGSIDNVTLALFEAEINSIVGEMHPACVDVIYCDAKVQKIDHFEHDDTVKLHAIGGGGTHFAPALDAAEALDDVPCCMVYLTDRYGPDRATPPDFPILWASIGEQSAPYGEVVSLENV